MDRLRLLPMNDILSQFTGLLDAKAAHIATLIVVAAGIIGRAYKSIRNGGGLMSLWHGLIYGGTPPAKIDPPTTADSSEKTLTITQNKP